MLVLGIKCTKDSIDWAVVSGDARANAEVIEHHKVTAPKGERGEQLMWARREIDAILDRSRVDESALKPSEPGGRSISLGRAEVEGVVQECLAARSVTCTRMGSSRVRSAFKAKNNAELKEREQEVPCLREVAASRRDAVLVAVAVLKG